MTAIISSIYSTLSSMLPFTKRSKPSPIESDPSPTTGWNEIPKEIRNIIFSMLSDKNRLDLFSISKENSRNITILSEQHTSKIASKYYSLPISRQLRCSIVDILMQVELYPLNLELNIDDINNIPAKVLERKSLSIKIRFIGNEAYKIEKLNDNILQKVKNIHVFYGEITSQILNKLILSCPELEEINIGECQNIQDLNLSNVVSTKIKKFYGQGTSITAQGVTDLLQKCPKLEELNIAHCKNIQDLDLSNVPPTKIKKIVLSDKYANIVPLFITSQSLSALLKKCPELEELDIARCQNIQNLDLSTVVFTKIKKILATWSPITSQGFATLLERCPELEELDITRCKNIQNLDLSNVVSTKIKTICSDNSSLTSQGLAALLEKCPVLEKLDISNCKNIQNLDLSNVVSTKIKTIHASYSFLTSQGLAALLEKCPKLEELNIAHCKNIQDLDLSNVPPTKIKVINASYSSLTSQGIAELFKKYPGVQTTSFLFPSEL